MKETNCLSKFHNPNALEEMLDYRLYLVYRDCGYLTEKVCKDVYGISRRRLRIIFILIEHPEVSVTELATIAELDIAQTSRTIGVMMREGYLRRLSNPDNARFAKLILTEKSHEIYSDILIRYKKINAELILNFDDNELIQLDNLLNRLRKNSEILKEKYLKGDYCF